MASEGSFAALIRRVRAGDPDAAAEVVRQYEPPIRRLVRLRLTDPWLTRVLDSMDICQSVMANFFIRAAAGQFDLEVRAVVAAADNGASQVEELYREHTLVFDARDAAYSPGRHSLRGARQAAEHSVLLRR
jgi:RNA polymerase sigma-70 factor (ECF subfamily)